MRKTKIQTIEDSYLKYMRLSSYLFGLGDKAIYDVNEIPEDNEFYPMAKKIAKDLNISWKSMNHNESNRIMLAMLSDAYALMNRCEKDKRLVYEYSIKIVDKR